MNLNEKVAIVTGASHGIGLAMAGALLNEGCRVAAFSRSEGELTQYLGNPHVLLVKADVSNPESVRQGVAGTVERFGGIDIVINNAGISVSEQNPVESSDIEECTRVVNTNLLGSFFLCHEALPYMKKRPCGYVIHVLSTLARSSAPGKSMYTASKFGQRGLCETMIKENLGTSIRVSSISPGGTNSNIWNLKKEIPGDDIRATLLKTEDVANAALFLLKQPDYVHIEDITITSWHAKL